jgi:hypothetical protein
MPAKYGETNEKVSPIGKANAPLRQTLPSDLLAPNALGTAAMPELRRSAGVADQILTWRPDGSEIKKSSCR